MPPLRRRRLSRNLRLGILPNPRTRPPRSQAGCQPMGPIRTSDTSERGDTNECSRRARAEARADFGQLQSTICRRTSSSKRPSRTTAAGCVSMVRTPNRRPFRPSSASKGPLVFYTDPTCTGRPVNDTFAVAWPEIESEVWWKDNMKPFDPDKYEGLLKRVVQHVNDRGGHLYVQDVYAGADPAYSIPVPLCRRVRDPRHVRPQHVPQACRRRRGRGRANAGRC